MANWLQWAKAIVYCYTSEPNISHSVSEWLATKATGNVDEEEEGPEGEGGERQSQIGWIFKSITNVSYC